MKMISIKAIYAIPVDGGDWRLLPNGDGLMIGPNVHAPEGLDLARIGESASIPEKIEWKFTELVVQCTRHLVTNCASGQISIGYEFFTFEQFRNATKEERAELQVVKVYAKAECAGNVLIVEFVIANGVPAEKEK